MRLLGKKHPSKAELLDYAGSLVGRTPLAASIGAHLTTCKKCAAEVDAMRTSLEFVADAPELEPSSNLTSRILVAARCERPLVATLPLRRLWNPRYAAGVVLYVSVAACVALCASAPVFLGYADARLDAARNASMTSSNAVQEDAEDTASAELKAIASEVETLAKAVRSGISDSQNASERIHQRAVNAMEAELSAAWAALEQNPGCAQASKLVQRNLERQAETYRKLYAERTR